MLKLKINVNLPQLTLLYVPFHRGSESIYETVPGKIKRCKNGAKKLPVYIWWQQCEVLVWNVRCYWQRLHNLRTVQTRWLIVHVLQFYNVFIFRVWKENVYQQYNFDHHLSIQGVSPNMLIHAPHPSNITCIAIELFSFECQKIIGVTLATFCDWLNKLVPIFIQSEGSRPKPIGTCLHMIFSLLRISCIMYI